MSLSNQEVFNKVYTHLLTQGRKAGVQEPDEVNEEGHVIGRGTFQCKYRDENMFSCAVGCLIAENEYKPTFEGKLVDTLLKHNVFENFDHDNLALLVDLQSVHDDYAPHDWPLQLEFVARNHNLTIPSNPV